MAANNDETTMNHLRLKIAEAREKHQRAKDLYHDSLIKNDDMTVQIARFDQGYYMGVAHALEETLDYLESDDDA